VELTEVEAALSACPQVQEAAAVGIPDDEIGKKIKAAVVLKEGSSVSESDIRLACGRQLPGYMVPEIVVFKAVLPRTPTGKIDKKQLETEKT